MFCSACGQQLQPVAAICPNCGRPVAASAPLAMVPSYRVQRHLQTVAILWLAYAFLGVLLYFAAIPFLGMAFGHSWGRFGGPFWMPMHMHWLFPFITVALYLRIALQALVGVGLMRRDRWARPLAIVVAVLTILKIPLGTALSIYTLWVLAPSTSGQEYDRLATP